jgi:hypothetical protein
MATQSAVQRLLPQVARHDLGQNDRYGFIEAPRLNESIPRSRSKGSRVNVEELAFAGQLVLPCTPLIVGNRTRRA